MRFRKNLWEGLRIRNVLVKSALVLGCIFINSMFPGKAQAEVIDFDQFDANTIVGDKFPDLVTFTGFWPGQSMVTRSSGIYGREGNFICPSDWENPFFGGITAGRCRDGLNLNFVQGVNNLKFNMVGVGANGTVATLRAWEEGSPETPIVTMYLVGNGNSLSQQEIDLSQYPNIIKVVVDSILVDEIGWDYFSFDIGGPPKIVITMDPPVDSENRYVIDETPIMPQMGVRAKIINVPDAPPSPTFNWTVELWLFKKKSVDNKAVDDLSKKVSFEGDLQAKTGTTIGNERFIIAVKEKDPAWFRGGFLKFSVETPDVMVDGKPLKASTPVSLKIEGKNAALSTVQTFIDQRVTLITQPDSDMFGIEVSIIKDVVKRIGCAEHNQRQFGDANILTPVEIGPPTVSRDNGVGMFQITNTDACPRYTGGEPFLFFNTPSKRCRNAIFSWQANASEGIATFRKKASDSKVYPSKLRKPESGYRDFIADINEDRADKELKPICCFPLPNFTTTGMIGANPTNQLLENAVRMYNGPGPNVRFTEPMQEFFPNEEYLRNVPDDELLKIRKNPEKFWRRVGRLERLVNPNDPDGPKNYPGDLDYVTKVTKRNPQTCISSQ